MKSLPIIRNTHSDGLRCHLCAQIIQKGERHVYSYSLGAHHLDVGACNEFITKNMGNESPNKVEAAHLIEKENI